MITITICMGSSCFSRGNAETAASIQQYVAENKLQDRVTVRGCLCEGECRNGPNIRVDNTLYENVSGDMAIDIIKRQLEVES